MLKKSTQECGVEIEKTRQMQEHHSINFYKHHQISGIGIGMGNGIGIDIFMGYIGCITLSTSTNTIRSQVLVLVLLLSRVSCWLHHVMMVVSLNQLLETRKNYKILRVLFILVSCFYDLLVKLRYIPLICHFLYATTLIGL